MSVNLQVYFWSSESFKCEWVALKVSSVGLVINEGDDYLMRYNTEDKISPVKTTYYLNA